MRTYVSTQRPKKAEKSSTGKTENNQYGEEILRHGDSIKPGRIRIAGSTITDYKTAKPTSADVAVAACLPVANVCRLTWKCGPILRGFGKTYMPMWSDLCD